MKKQTHPVERRAFNILDVDISTLTAHVEDQTGGRILVSFRNKGAAFQIPQQNEQWICERNTGHEWHLWRRLDKNAEYNDLSSTHVAGDTRIQAPNTLRLRSQAMELNQIPIGASWQENKTAVGAQTSWTLTHTPIQASTVRLYNNGILVSPSTVTLSGNVLTFPSILSGHSMTVYYQINS